MYCCIVVCQFLGREKVVSIKSISEVVVRKICTEQGQHSVSTCQNRAYPDSIISSSKPYNFICCRPHPSFILLGMYFFFQPFRLGVWNIAILTRSPKEVINGASKVAHDGFGSSLVPRNASVRMDTSSCGFLCSASEIVLMSSCSFLPMYNVER